MGAGTLRIGVGIFTGQVRPGGSPTREYVDLLNLAEVAERYGYDSLWVSEHHFAADSYLPSLMPVLGAVAARTTRLTLGTAVILAPFHHPLRLAEDVAVVDRLSGGRMILGLGLGWREEEFRAFGVPRAERVGRLRETVRILRSAWSGRRSSFHGRHYSFSDVRVTPTPAHDIPIWIGASVPRGVERAARLGDGFIASKTSLHGFREMFQAAALSRPGIPLAAMLDVWVGVPNEEVLRGFWHKTDTYAAWRAGDDAPGRGITVPSAHEGAPADLIFGGPRDLLERLRPYAELQPGHPLTLVLRFHYPGVGAARVAEALERFGSDVLPQLREMRTV